MQPKDDYRDLTDEELEEPATARRGSIEVDQLEYSETDEDDLLEPTLAATDITATRRAGIDSTGSTNPTGWSDVPSSGRSDDVDEDAERTTGGELKRIQKDNAGVFDDIKQSWKDNSEVLKEMKREITGKINTDDGEEPFEDDRTTIETQRGNPL